MADASRNIPNTRATQGPASELFFPLATMKTGVTFYQGAAMFRDPADSRLLKTSPSGNPQFEPYAVSAVKQLGDGTLVAESAFGPHVFDNSATSGETVPASLPFGWPLYAKDNRTVSLTDGGGLYPRLGWFGGMTGESTARPIVWVGFCPFAIEEFVISKAYGHADLTDADTSQDFELYTLPGPAVVMGPPWLRTLTAFTGGSISALTLAIGVDSDPDALGDEKSIFTGGSTGAFTAGVNGAAGYPLSAGGVIKAQFVSTDDNLVNATAGALVFSLRLKAGSY